jgi:hypothetical protein
LGWALVPLAPHTKKPHADLLPKGHDGKAQWSPLARRRASRPEIRDWFDQDPEINIGVITGEPSGVVVLDYDHAQPPLPLTPIAQSARGVHAYFRAGAHVPSRAFSWGELRGEGNYVVLPPSWHPSGVQYRWAELLSPFDTDPADFRPELLETEPSIGVQANPKRHGVARNNIVPRYTCPEMGWGKPEKLGELVALAANSDVVRVVLRAAGIVVPGIGKAFLCPLPGHDEQRRRPSAALWHDPGRPIVMHCFHCQGTADEWWPVADVYAGAVSGRWRRLGCGERAAWWLRALADTRQISPPCIDAPALPAGAPGSVRLLYDGFIRLMELRAVYDPDQVGVPFSAESHANLSRLSHGN